MAKHNAGAKRDIDSLNPTAKWSTALGAIAASPTTPKEFVEAYGPAILKQIMSGKYASMDGQFLELTQLGEAVLRRTSGKGRPVTVKQRVGELFGRLSLGAQRVGRKVARRFRRR